MKKRILSGIQPSGKLHIGNYFAMIKRMVGYQESSDLFLFLANLHSLTTIQDGAQLEALTREAAIDLLALGVDPKKSTFWVQSDVPEVTELAWILSCITPFGLMERAHSYKDKVAKGIHPTLGLFAYPALMTADILIYQSHHVPVGKDQKQHIEFARDIAEKFNHQYKTHFTIPEPDIAEDVAVVPGTDGQKMSKSYGNTIPIFGTDKEIEKAVMGIKTDSKGVEESKEAEGNTVYELYKLFATPAETKDLAARFKKGGLGYGDAKKMLLAKIKEEFAGARVKREEFLKSPEKVDAILKEGAAKARKVAIETLNKVRKSAGLQI